MKKKKGKNEIKSQHQRTHCLGLRIVAVRFSYDILLEKLFSKNFFGSGSK